jgi:aspartyl/asparaginyl beta-hydroxylase (cupin superfamily)
MIAETSTLYPPANLDAALVLLGTRDASHGRSTLYDHLVGTSSVLKAWQQPERIVMAGLFHSIYSTPNYQRVTLPYDQRPVLRSLLGTEAEELVFLFSRIALYDLRKALLEEKDQQIGDLVTLQIKKKNADSSSVELILQRAMVDDLLILHLANLFDQTAREAGSPGLCLNTGAELVGLIKRSNWTGRSTLIALGQPLSLHAEYALLDRYAEMLRHRAATGILQEYDVTCPGWFPDWIPELQLWRSVYHAERHQWDLAKDHAQHAQDLFSVRCVTWDKRLEIDEWITIAQELSDGLLTEDALGKLAGLCVSAVNTLPDGSLPNRFYRFLSDNSRPHQRTSNLWYPELTANPFHDPSGFPVVQLLEDNYGLIRQEVLHLEESLFHSEAEAIDRVGRWEVMILFETGRKNEENCKKVPKLAAMLSASPDVRTSAGLVYLSRLKAGTKVAPHRGGSNLRLRLHLGIEIPEGDCAMRVDSEVRGWSNGKCMVIDDFYEHEVWNNTDKDRLVLVADLWHPDLSEAERGALEALNYQVERQAKGRLNYWNMNAKQHERERSSK